MSFREKSAWITLVTVLVCFGVYFGAIASGLVSPRGLDTLHLLLACVVALVALQAALTVAAALTTPKDGRAPRDEREQLIQSRSHTLGYYLLVVLVLGLFIPGHLGHTVIDMMNFALLDVAIAAVAVAGAQIVMFRRGA
jgi:cytochrome bd-type quinol oxidase subunit 2